MIAQLTLTMGGRLVVATLTDAFEWDCDDLLIKTFLDTRHGRISASTPAGGKPGVREARSAAEAAERAGWNVEIWFANAEQDAA
jgi:hypothetical protein